MGEREEGRGEGGKRGKERLRRQGENCEGREEGKAF